MITTARIYGSKPVHVIKVDENSGDAVALCRESRGQKFRAPDPQPLPVTDETVTCKKCKEIYFQK